MDKFSLKLDLPRAAVFSVVAICLTVLVAMGKIDYKLVLQGMAFWLVPSPIRERPLMGEDEEK